MHRTLLITLLLAAMPMVAAAQWIKRGDYVRVSAEQYPDLRGRVKLLTAQTIVVDTVQLPLSSVNNILVRHRKSNDLKGAMIGTLVGGGFGALFFLGGDDCSSSDWICISGRDLAPYTTAVGAAAGFLIGTVIGALDIEESWQPVPVKRLNVSVIPQRDRRFALGLSVPF